MPNEKRAERITERWIAPSKGGYSAVGPARVLPGTPPKNPASATPAGRRPAQAENAGSARP